MGQVALGKWVLQRAAVPPEACAAVAQYSNYVPYVLPSRTLERLSLSIGTARAVPNSAKAIGRTTSILESRPNEQVVREVYSISLNCMRMLL